MKRECNHCGRCCTETPCRVALALIVEADFGNPCPALERHGDSYFCGIFLDINKYANKKIVRSLSLNLESITYTMKHEFIGICDSKFGKSKIDQRIPIHQL